MATKITLDGYNSYSGADIVVTAQLSNINSDDKLSKKCYILGSLQTISISTYQDKSPVRAIGNINALDYLMGPRSIAGSLVFAVFDRHFAYEIFNDLKEYTGSSSVLSDEIPALDMTLSFQNEYGHRSRMTLYGVKLVTEGQVMSINDLFTENTYQFVALGLENLTVENGDYQKFKAKEKSLDPIIDPTNEPFPIPNLDPGSMFKYDDDNNDDDDINKKSDPEYVKINQPINDDDFGQIIVKINKPDKIEMYLINKYKEDDEGIKYNSDMFKDTNEWVLNVPPGYYNLIFIDKETGETINEIQNISIDVNKDYSILNDYPIICYVSDTMIKAKINNPNHNQMNICINDSIIETVFPEYEICIFDNLSPSITYSFFSNDTNNKYTDSKISLCTTLSHKYETENNFESFVFDNKKLWENDLSTFNFDLLNENNNSNLINKIDKTSYEYKDELLLYAIKYQNDLLKCANSDNDISIINNRSLLEPIFEPTGAYKEMDYYYVDDNNFYYSATQKFSEYNFILPTTQNKHCYVYSVNENNTKSLQYDFYTYNNNSKKNLSLYNLKEIDYDDYNYNMYRDTYPIMDDNLLETIILKDNNFAQISLLNRPMAMYDITNDDLFVKIEDIEKLDINKNYYLCICEKNDMFQHTPIIKIKVSFENNSFTLDKYKTHIHKNKYYLIYIENDIYQIISPSTIISTYNDNNELYDYYYKECKDSLDNICSSLFNIYSNKELIKTASLSALSYDNLLIDDENNLFIQELLNQGYDSEYNNNMDLMIYDTLVLTFNTYNKKQSVSYNNSNIYFNDVNINVIILDFYLNEDTPIKTVLNPYAQKTNIPFIRNSLYTVYYSINRTTKNKIGFVLKNNSNNKIYTYKTIVEEVY